MLGSIAAHVRVVEFERRGFLHVYCIFFDDQASKQRQKRQENVECLVRADIRSVQDQDLVRWSLKYPMA